MFLPTLAPLVHTGTWRASPVRLQAAVFSSWQISSLGRTKNTRGQVFVGSKGYDGYRRVQISLPSRQKKNFLVHRLVAFAFHGPPASPQLVVNHIDGDRANNCPDNLEYVTHSENARHALRAKASQNRSGKVVLVQQIGAQTWTTYTSMRQAAQALGVHHSSVVRCCKGMQLMCQGHKVMLAPVADLPGEIWAAAVCPKTSSLMPGYQVSTHGRIQGPTAFISQGSYNLSGYRRIIIAGRWVYIHRIVAATFLRPPANSIPWEVDHKDGNRSNNVVDNLEVVTHSENMRRAWATRENRSVVSTRRSVRGRRLLSDTWCTFSSVSEAADYVEGHVSDIVKCCKGQRKTSRGYEWEYNEVDPSKIATAEVWREVDVQGLLAAWDRKCRTLRCSNSEGEQSPVREHVVRSALNGERIQKHGFNIAGLFCTELCQADQGFILWKHHPRSCM